MTNGPVAYVVYGLHSGNGVIRYVGISQNLVKRFWEHKNRAIAGGKLPSQCWIRKYGVENIQYEILQVCETYDELLTWEPIWIESFRSLGYGLLNVTDGGEGHVGYMATPETRAKQSAALKGRKLSPEHIAKISAGNRGKIISQESRDRMSAAQRLRPAPSESTREKIRQRTLASGKVGELASQSKLSNQDALAIVEKRKKGFLMRELADEYGVTRKTVSSLLSGKTWSTVTGIGL